MHIKDRLQIKSILHRVGSSYHVNILFACESGSRAWGFASPDSDYDIRFIYVRPISSYLGLSARRDVMDNLAPSKTLDLVGWDILKALELASDSNPQIIEWVNSDLIYYEYGDFRRTLRDIMLDFKPRALMHHYASLAHTTHKAAMKTGATKSYLYSLRATLAVLWMHQNQGGMVAPPILFSQLFNEIAAINGEVRDIEREVNTLVCYKRMTAEKETIELPLISDFLNRQVPNIRLLAQQASDERSPDLMRLEDLAQSVIRAGR